jgi:hypothetical protein
VVAHDYPLAPWPHDRVVSMEVQEKLAISGSAWTVLYLYTVPARIAGRWTLEIAGRQRPAITLDVAQRDGRSSASAVAAGRVTALPDFHVQGDRVWFTLPVAGRREAFEGRVVGDVIEGAAAPRWRAVRVAR